MKHGQIINFGYSLLSAVALTLTPTALAEDAPAAVPAPPAELATPEPAPPSKDLLGEDSPPRKKYRIERRGPGNRVQIEERDEQHQTVHEFESDNGDGDRIKRRVEIFPGGERHIIEHGPGEKEIIVRRFGGAG